MQRTLSNVVRTSGIGLHTGKQVIMSMYPAPENSGIVFVYNQKQIPAVIWNVTTTKMATTLMKDGSCVATIEHLMAALYGMKISNCFIHLDAPEVPAMDGSAEPFVSLIEESGIEIQDAPRKILRIKKEVSIRDGESAVSIAPSPSSHGGFSIASFIDYEHPLIGKQRYEFDFYQDSFVNDVSRARTFGFEKDVESMRRRGLALGGSTENAIVLTEDDILNENGLRYENEFARHKVLDVIGDISLCGYEVEGFFAGSKSGHALNVALLEKLMLDEKSYDIIELK